MTKRNQIENYAHQVAMKFRPERIVLFGSHGRGQAGPDSDVDLLVVMKHKGRASRQALAIRQGVRKNFPLDLLVQSPAETRRRLREGDPLVTEALTTGLVLYEKP